MKMITLRLSVLIAMILLVSFANKTQTTLADHSNSVVSTEMKTYIIERDIPGAGKLTQEQLKAISQTSCSVLKEMGPKIQWIQSYVTGDKIFCIYKALNIELVKEHAKKGGFPANSIIEVSTIISPATAE